MRGSSLLAETDGSGNPVNEYIYFDGMRIARRDSSGNVYYSFGNELGSPTVTTATGSICYDADFYPFGGEHAYTSTCAPNQKFAGMEQDSATGLYRTLFRQYAANNGRWLSPDPYAGSYDPSNPQSMNRYAYVMNGPMNWIDPWGLDDGCPATICRIVWGFPILGPPGGSGGGPCNGFGGPMLPAFAPVNGVNGPEIAEMPGTGPMAAAGCGGPTGPQGGGNPGNGTTKAPNNSQNATAQQRHNNCVSGIVQTGIGLGTTIGAGAVIAIAGPEIAAGAAAEGAEAATAAAAEGFVAGGGEGASFLSFVHGYESVGHLLIAPLLLVGHGVNDIIANCGNP